MLESEYINKIKKESKKRAQNEIDQLSDENDREKENENEENEPR